MRLCELPSLANIRKNPLFHYASEFLKLLNLWIVASCTLLSVRNIQQTAYSVVLVQRKLYLLKGYISLSQEIIM